MNHDVPSWRPANPTRFFVADDHEIVRVGLRSMLEAEREFESVGEAATGREAIELCRRFQPQLALIDGHMPDMGGLEATRAIKQEYPAIRVVIITFYDHPRFLREARSAGASACLLKDITRAELVATVWQVLGTSSANDGQLVLAPRHRIAEPALERLTPRERDVLRCVVQGQTNREIAQTLSLSPGTVKAYVEQIIAKLHVSSRTHAAVRAVELGLLHSTHDRP
jgi:RNA polymerase sigma factor (sigma-70 family)